VKITFDPAKRASTLQARGIDFAEAADVFEGDTFDFPDERFEYGETRIITIGHLRARMMILVWTQRGDARHVISMRKANEREQAHFGKRFAKD
jgi:uncharacterized protein